MSTLLDEATSSTTTNSAARLRATMAAVRIAFTWFGVRKTLTAEQKAQAADTFGAEGEFLSAGKKLLDTRHPAFKAVTAVRGRILSVWKGFSLPYPEPGKRWKIESFMSALKRTTGSTLQARHTASLFRYHCFRCPNYLIKRPRSCRASKMDLWFWRVGLTAIRLQCTGSREGWFSSPTTCSGARSKLISSIAFRNLHSSTMTFGNKSLPSRIFLGTSTKLGDAGVRLFPES